MKRTIEIDDTLDNRVECAIDEVKSELENYLNNNPDTDSVPCLNNDLDYDGAIHSIVDSSVPVYTHEIKTAWFLHGSELEEAYKNAGIGDNPMENDGMAAIYFWVHCRNCSVACTCLLHLCYWRPRRYKGTSLCLRNRDFTLRSL